MLRVGITGGIGSGKTALTDWLATQGIVIVDADLAARIVVEPGQPALAEIAEHVWRGVLCSPTGSSTALRSGNGSFATKASEKRWKPSPTLVFVTNSPDK